MINNKNNKRELAYIVEVEETRGLDGYNNVHYVHINGWWCVATKSLNTGDKAVYFEIDSLLPKEDKRFVFMVKRKYRVKTQKMCKVISQGLVLPIIDFPELSKCRVGDFVTDKLKVTLYEPEIKDYKPQNRVTPFQKAKDRHRKLFEFPLIKFMLRFTWFRILMEKVFIHKKDKLVWPCWLPKTGSERIQNLPQLFDVSNKETYIVTEKVDGMSTTFILDEKDVYFVGSHNILIFNGNINHSNELMKGQSYIKNNVWMDMGEKYSIKDKLKYIKENNHLNTVVIQGESYGSGVQKRTYSKKHGVQDFVVFHIWFNGTRLSVQEMVKVCEEYSLPHVHIFDWDYHLPSTVEEIIKDIDFKDSGIDGGDIEGFVIYSKDGKQNFKCVSPSYILKYHS